MVFYLIVMQQFCVKLLDMSDDVYGHSVEDYDMAVSPTTG